MTRVCIEADEWYPVYSADADLKYSRLAEGVVDVDDATLARWAKVFEEFEAVQKELRALLKQSASA